MRDDQPIRGRCAAAALALALLATAGASRAADDAAAVLAEADAVRNPRGSFSVNVRLTEYRNGELNDSSSLTIYSRPAALAGQYANLARYTRPATEAGKLLLRNGADLWFFDPESKASVRISAQARLLGQASNGDVLSTNLGSDFVPELVGREPVEDDTRTPRDALRLRLAGRHEQAGYAAIDFWVDARNRRPIKAQFRSAEGRLLKTAFYRRYQEELGAQRPTETVIVDGLDTSWITVIRMDGYQAREVPQAWLQRDYLPRFTGDER
ncbi:MAG: outer membrane lipoprotein-sorting protein [Piscinibacter sp.]|uniref:outer membrane lipoprotein-sorting protein n=1 Tax=Piscinibacter TaxID=1114981 RepID=UPI000FDD4672|nr:MULTISPECIES: outer membrane lipoprotein-sorting protein [Piscinibacter]MCW5667478.1 outer membrane lipoprotein-sorting protein [Piscinibacter sp.]